MTRPGDLIWRSPAAPALEAAGASFIARDDAAIAETVPGTTTDQAERAGLADLSPLPRTGFKGAGTFDWLTAQGLPAPETNRWTRTEDGLTVARLGPGEALLFTNDGARLAELTERQRAEEPTLCYPVPRRDSHVWYRLTGREMPELFARLCAVDLRPETFPADGIAQTSMALVSAVVVRDDAVRKGGSLPAFHLFADFASGKYLWETLARAANDLGGGPMGLDILRALAASPFEPGDPA